MNSNDKVQVLTECIREARSIEELAERLEAADVVPVVRCADCVRFLKMEVSPSYDGKCLGYGYPVEARHFCSYGEEKKKDVTTLAGE